jgi:hypothetical protein
VAGGPVGGSAAARRLRSCLTMALQLLCSCLTAASQRPDECGSVADSQLLRHSFFAAASEMFCLASACPLQLLYSCCAADLQLFCTCLTAVRHLDGGVKAALHLIYNCFGREGGPGRRCGLPIDVPRAGLDSE